MEGDIGRFVAGGLRMEAVALDEKVLSDWQAVDCKVSVGRLFCVILTQVYEQHQKLLTSEPAEKEGRRILGRGDHISTETRLPPA